MWIVLLILVVLIVAFIGIYNGLVKLRVRVDNSWADVDVQLKRRYDLIPNLVETVKGYASHEKETLENVIAARNMAMAARGPKEAGVAEGALGAAISGIFGIAEAYPDLKANENMMQFQEELTSTENKVAFARQAFNDAVLQYNNSVQNFPNNVIAGFFRFDAASFLEIDSEEVREAPDVSFT